ncbi:MAG: exo-alpha-sialidase [Chloroflexi bacterium]|nr:exo-alpha-sialidase [Chloroflexota bacterium]
MQKFRSLGFQIFILLLAAYACSSNQSAIIDDETSLPDLPVDEQGESPGENGETGLSPVENALLAPELEILDFHDGKSVNFTISSNGIIYIAFGKGTNLYVMRSLDMGRTFEDAVLANSGVSATVYAWEVPAVTATEEGVVRVAFILPEGDSGSVWMAVSEDGGQSFSPSRNISGNSMPRTYLVQLSLDELGNPILSWLQDGNLGVARSFDRGATFAVYDSVDAETCDCCQPQTLGMNGQTYIVYRNLEFSDPDRQIRDIYLVSMDQGSTIFNPEVRISDAPWYFNACPISGTSLVSDGETIYVSWMDGRNDTAGNLSQTDIWLASSSDGGQTFSANWRVNSTSGVFNNRPSIALDEDGGLHVVWETQNDGADMLNYAWSGDGGVTFTEAIPIVSSDDGSGRGAPNNPSLVYFGGNLYITWMDNLGGHFTFWPLGDG